MEGLTATEINGSGTKRGSEDMLYQTPTNGSPATNVLSSITGDEMSLLASDAKKVKLDKVAPSKVVHIRNLSDDASEAEVVNLGVPFGHVTNLLMLKGKNQAFLELADEAVAQRLIDYYTKVSVNLRGRPIYVQYSNYKELKTTSAHAQQAVAVQAALQAVNAVLSSSGQHGGSGDHALSEPSLLDPPTSASLERNAISQAAAQAALQAAQSILPGVGLMSPKVADSGGGANHVLHATIENCLIQVTIEALVKVFSPYGQVLKIVTFTKNNTFQALIQLSDAMAASTARMALDGQHIYTGCCTLRIVFSKLTSLSVKYNNDKSRDFTRPDLPFGEGVNHMDHAHHHHHHLAALGNAGRFHHPGAGGPISMFTPFMSPGIAGLTQAPHAAFTGAAFSGATAVPGLGSTFPAAIPSHHLAARMQQSMGGMGGMGMGMGGMQSHSPVVLVSNLTPELITPQDLFTLFGVYGDVVRVKILYEKRDNALIQLMDPIQSTLAIQHLNGTKLYGKQLRVAPSKHQMVQMPKEGQPDAGLTKDFTNSPLHRFKKPGSKNFQNIFPPSAVLHLSNIPPTTEEEELKSAFSQHGAVVAFKFFPKDRKMALIEMSTVEESIHALIALHNYQLSETNHLRVSFSKATISPGS